MKFKKAVPSALGLIEQIPTTEIGNQWAFMGICVNFWLGFLQGTTISQ